MLPSQIWNLPAAHLPTHTCPQPQTPPPSLLSSRETVCLRSSPGGACDGTLLRRWLVLPGMEQLLVEQLPVEELLGRPFAPCHSLAL